MVRTPCCDKSQIRKGTWTPEEDRKLLAYVTRYGCWNWRQLPKYAGLARCGKSCRLRWMNYLRPNIKRGNYSEEEEETIIRLHESLGNRWSAIAAQLPGRTDNEIKNLWHTRLKKSFQNMPSSSDGKDKTNTQDQNKHKEREFETKPSDYLLMETINITPPLILGSSLSSPQSASSDRNSSIMTDNSTAVSSKEPVSDDLSTNNNMAMFEDLELVDSGSFWTEPFFSDSLYVDSPSYEAQFEILDGEILCPFGFYDQLGNFSF